MRRLIPGNHEKTPFRSATTESHEAMLRDAGRRYFQIIATGTLCLLGAFLWGLDARQAWVSRGLFALLLVAAFALLYRLRVGWFNRRAAQLTQRVEERSQALSEEIARRQQAEAALRASEERYALVINGTNDGIWDWDIANGRIYYSPRFKSILGYGETEIGEHPQEWLNRIHPEDAQRVKDKLASQRSGGVERIDDEHRVRHKDGSYRWVLMRSYATGKSDGVYTRIVGALMDVTDRRAYDPITALPNRVLFLERVRDAIQHAKQEPAFRFAVLFLNLDRFKLVNESLGHLVGDEYLVAIAERLEQALGDKGFLARFGGDEFAILIEGPQALMEAPGAAENLRLALAKPLTISAGEVFASATIGIAVSTMGYERAEDVLRDAGTALFSAKSGSGTMRHAVFDVGMRTQSMERLRLEGELRRALDHDELRLHYQPIIDLTSGRVDGFEALIRWQHPRLGLLLPEGFIKLAEETGLVVPIGYWVLNQACRQMRDWRQTSSNHTSLSLSVNMSGRHFSDTELSNRIAALLCENDLAPTALRLEITESMLIDLHNGASKTLDRLRELGVQMDIDDFGTGYSSLKYLVSLPISALKIDRSFIARMGSSSQGRTVVHTILNLARCMSLKVIAEGVETRAQLATLRELQCGLAQGFFFSAAVDAEKATAMLPTVYPVST